MIALPTITKEETQRDHQDKKNKTYDYFHSKIPKPTIDSLLKLDKDERYLYFLCYGNIRRFEGEGEVLYVEIPQMPKIIVVYRRPITRNKSIEKLYLNKKGLPHVPLLEGEETLKLLSLESNLITKIDHLISLNNLLFLNLYENRITEIENLSTVPRLKALMLGKNMIEKIKNMSFLQDLEVLDLHSNKIKLIENLGNLRRLRILNLANNQITSFVELMINRNLEDLNLRKNLIVSIPNMTNNFDKMKKINLGRNMISKIDFILELKKLKRLEEVYIEENPVLYLKDSYDKLSPLHLKFKDPKLKELFFTEKKFNGENTSLSSNNVLLYSKKEQEGGGFSPNNSNNTNMNHSTNNSYNVNINNGNNNNNNMNNSNSNNNTSNKNQINNNQKAVATIENQDANLSEDERTSLLSKIKNEWELEYGFMVVNGFNGYNIKKLKETKIQLCHAEIEREKQLNLFGNAIEVLGYKEFHNIVNTIHIEYFNYDIFSQANNLSNLHKFSNLKSLVLLNNNLHSFYQIIKLEELKDLEYLTIKENELCSSGILKYFLVYRLHNIKYINDVEITSKDIMIAKKIFENFEKAISYLEEKKTLEKEKKSEGNSNSNSNSNSNCNRNNNQAIVDNQSTNTSNGKVKDDGVENKKLSKSNIEQSAEAKIDKAKEKVDLSLKNQFFNFLKENIFIVIDEIIES